MYGASLAQGAALQEFQDAWQHHYSHNPHHPEYWQQVEEDGAMRANWMPPTYVREMVADWYGAGYGAG